MKRSNDKCGLNDLNEHHHGEQTRDSTMSYELTATSCELTPDHQGRTEILAFEFCPLSPNEKTQYEIP